MCRGLLHTSSTVSARFASGWMVSVPRLAPATGREESVIILSVRNEREERERERRYHGTVNLFTVRRAVSYARPAACQKPCPDSRPRSRESSMPPSNCERVRECMEGTLNE